MTSSLTQGQTVALGLLAGGASTSLTFAQFDPSLGTLTGIVVTTTLDVAASAALENLQLTPAQLTADFAGGLTLTAPAGAQALAINDAVSQTATLAAFDGTIDGAGASGTTFSLTGSLTASGTSVAGQDLTGLTGTGTVALTAQNATALGVTGGGNFFASTVASEAGSVVLQYVYTPISGGGGSGGSGTTITTVFPPYIPPGSVTTTVQSLSVADQTTNWSHVLTVAQFDPTLGTLEYVNIRLSGDLSRTLRLENLGASAPSIVGNDTGTLTVSGFGTNDPVKLVLNSPLSASLTAYDGSTDYAGSSGTTQNATTTGSIDLTSFGDAATLAAFEGTGTVGITAASTASASLNTAADSIAELTTATGATLDISYTYLPAALANAACYAADTQIRTEHGDRPIETIIAGDRVLTHRGQLATVIWTGERRMRETDAVHIAPHAFGPNLPAAPLVLSPDHAVFRAGVLIPIRHLVNGGSIVLRRAARITWHHLELAAHDVILAENLPAETYLDTGNRTAFEGPVMDLRPRFGDLDPFSVWRRHACARLLLPGPELDAIRATLPVPRETAAARH